MSLRLPGLKRSASLVDSLIIDYESIIQYQKTPIHLPNLTALTTRDPKNMYWFENQQDLVALIQSHQQTLTFISLTLHHCPCLTYLKGCTFMSDLRLSPWVPFSIDHWRIHFNSLFARLQSLAWEGYFSEVGRLGDRHPSEEPELDLIIAGLPQLQSLTKGAPRSKLQYLELKASVSYWRDSWSIIQSHLFLILLSPELIQLTWTSPRGSLRVAEGMITILAAAIRFWNENPPASQRVKTKPATMTRFRRVIALMISSRSSSSPSTLPTTSTAAKAAAAAGQPLQRLEYLHLSDTTFSNGDFKDVVQTCTTLTRLILRDSSFDAESWQVLKQAIPHCVTTFKELVLEGSERLSGLASHDMLSSLSGLQIFSAPWVSDRDLLNRSGGGGGGEIPWVCEQLRELSLGFMLSCKDRGNKHILKRLSKLTGLTELNLRVMDSCEIPSPPQSTLSSLPLLMDDAATETPAIHPCLQISLAHGMDVLKTLTRLERIWGSSCERILWSETDIEWVLEHWTRLKSLKGFCAANTVPMALKDKMQRFNVVFRD